LDSLNSNASFAGTEAKRLFQALEDRFPLQVRVDALYDAAEGRPQLFHEILRFRQQLAKEAAFGGLPKIVVTADLSITHPDGRPCVGKSCTFDGCLNNK
jgi:hypothetical protein